MRLDARVLLERRAVLDRLRDLRERVERHHLDGEMRERLAHLPQFSLVLRGNHNLFHDSGLLFPAFPARLADTADEPDEVATEDILLIGDELAAALPPIVEQRI